ncbi:zinc ABC transporter substrate-binding protein [Roseobacter ponti]|uniref:High-affinity zinc uptake system protein ZnuA n=1 Tax=Roseobacter ponti TaxID=1891787 RepID=A0A858SVJ9_9RHOB|nr:zinc ABC transporter substrate-binding protein [Roseobacter ponti]QJF51683.1 zinc ABC transporter solute-binding protein [Roseobacter ponti]
MRVLTVCATLLAGTCGALAEAPRVVTDIAPVQGLVDQVMAGVGSADVLLPPGASPHSYAMRPSEARALSSADLVIWVGPALTPWLADPIETLAGDAQRLTLTGAEGVQLLTFRSGGSFEPHDHDTHTEHDAHEDHDGDHAHEDHAGHAEEDHDHGTPEHAGADEAHDDHDHAGDTDPHIWLDPQNAQAILTSVAGALAELDPANAALYRENARAGREEIAQTAARIAGQMASLQDIPFIVFHDAFQYFEARFGLSARAAVSLAHGEGASAGHVSHVRRVVRETGAVCVMAEPPVQQGLIDAVTGSGDQRVEAISPLAGENPADKIAYGAFLMQIAEAFRRCLAPA